GPARTLRSDRRRALPRRLRGGVPLRAPLVRPVERELARPARPGTLGPVARAGAELHERLVSRRAGHSALASARIRAARRRGLPPRGRDRNRDDNSEPLRQFGDEPDQLLALPRPRRELGAARLR